jgi:hypothetical protein
LTIIAFYVLIHQMLRPSQYTFFLIKVKINRFSLVSLASENTIPNRWHLTIKLSYDMDGSYICDFSERVEQFYHKKLQRVNATVVK